MTEFISKTRTALLVSSALLLPVPAVALSITTNNSALDLANALFLNFGGLTVTGASFSGEADQAGTWTNAAGTYGLPQTGIILSNGDVQDYNTGPNLSDSNSTDFGVPATAPQEALLDPITGGGFDHYDVSQLTIEFDAAPTVDEVTFFGTFGSEEFPEYVGSEYVDGFGLFVNGTNVASAPTAIGSAPINIDHPEMRAVAGTELDGILAPQGNSVLQFDAPINPGDSNVFDIIIADTSDGIYDSTIYLSSFFGEGEVPGDGETEFNPILPEDPEPEDGTFLIELPEGIEEGETIWIDPPVSIGFEYEITGGPAFVSITAPSLATVPDLDGYFVSDGILTVPLAAAATLDLVATFGGPLTAFTLTGVNPALMLDPNDPAAFPLGVVLDGITAPLTVIEMTPITAPIPLPATAALYLGAVAAGGMVLRRRRRAA